jgi:nucleotide-binding universal stress UspA family protein
VEWFTRFFASCMAEIFIDVKSIIESIIEYATQKNIDLIVIGTRGRTGLKRFLMGSVANGVV